ncbi:hypothetical protein G3T36_18195 [Diaminobutyricibacter tongyongensis]|uniref:Uncharacterized protein n=1 Tax=Leifsonia tongyongensis TaxID=1268043 RepID=A0A6L9Y294_9MICO|nr:hypothetical protein [Diaminobutyricibacter tongyongensis]NEN07790.1 hypothetical protein [Diaminobutyricibacter tongyongensis]
MLSDEYGVLDAVRSRVKQQLPGAEFVIVRSAEPPWEWSLQVALPGGHPRHLYWRSNQWHSTMRYVGEDSEVVYVLESIASAVDEIGAVDRGQVIALAAAGSVALDVIADGHTDETPIGAAEVQAALAVFGAVVMTLEESQRPETWGDPETRALASTLRSEWLIGRLDDLQG